MNLKQTLQQECIHSKQELQLVHNLLHTTYLPTHIHHDKEIITDCYQDDIIQFKINIVTENDIENESVSVSDSLEELNQTKSLEIEN